MKKFVSIILLLLFLFLSTIVFADNGKDDKGKVPQGLGVQAVSTSQINLKWSAIDDNSGIVGYKIFRNGVQIKTVINSTSYSDTGLCAGTVYSYSICTFDQAGNNSSQCLPVLASTLSCLNNESGLTGEYYDNMNFTNLIQTRIDPYISFNWVSGAPATSMGADTFSICWTGQLLPLYSDEYTFGIISDDGVVLWVNGIKIIDKWKDQSKFENKGKIKLVAGQKVDIRLEYYENTRNSNVKLYWSSSNQPKQIIPQSQLFSGYSYSVSAYDTAGNSSDQCSLVYVKTQEN